MTLGSKKHTVGNKQLWRVNYAGKHAGTPFVVALDWLANGATIVSGTASSSSPTCTVLSPAVNGHELHFF